MVLLKIKGRPFYTAILQTYAPTADYTDEQLEKYCENVQQTLTVVKSSDVLIVMEEYGRKSRKN